LRRARAGRPSSGPMTPQSRAVFFVFRGFRVCLFENNFDGRCDTVEGLFRWRISLEAGVIRWRVCSISCTITPPNDIKGLRFSVLSPRRPFWVPPWEKHCKPQDRFENCHIAPIVSACSPLSGRWTAPSTMGEDRGGLHACVTDVPQYHLGGGS
jgi:hypothetical protein